MATGLGNGTWVSRYRKGIKKKRVAKMALYRGEEEELVLHGK